MCTLILGLGILGPGSLLLGANRDESPKRPSSDPGVLVGFPRVVGGRDLVSGGTWLAVRDARFVTALMNRRPVPGDARDPGAFRSRGLLCLDAAVEGGGRGESHLDAALRLVNRDAYGPCTLIGVGLDGEAWALKAVMGEPEIQPISRGWHVITHQSLDDSGEPRTRWIYDDLRQKRPLTVKEALELMAGYLRSHGEGGLRGEGGAPPVCLHRDVFPTVSSSLIALGESGGPRYLHASGPPCTTEYRDYTPLLQNEGG